MTTPTIPIRYLGLRNAQELRQQMRLPQDIADNIENAYDVLFSDGMEFSEPGRPGRAWVVGRAARAGDPTRMPAAEADRRAGGH